MKGLAGFIAGFVLSTGSTVAAPDETLLVAFDACFASVTSGRGIEELAEYGMQPQEPDQYGNAKFAGSFASPLGEMPVSALFRDGVLFDCKLGTSAPDVPNAVSFEAAEETVLLWFGWLDEELASKRVDTNANHVSSVLCLPELDGLAVSVGALTMGSERTMPEIDPPIPDQLQFSVFLTHPDNFEECA